MTIPPEFHFVRPWWLWALIPAAALLVWLWRREHPGRLTQQFVDPSLLPHLLLDHKIVGSSRLPPLSLLGCGWLVAVLALAGPVWHRQPQPIYALGRDRVLILDLSPSMMATDIEPSRLERGIYKLRDILARSREGRIGLVVFGGDSHVVVPLTDDIATVETMLPALNVDIIPVPGDALAPALEQARALLSRGGHRQGEILLLTDGVADLVTSLKGAEEIRRSGTRLSVLSIGTEQGGAIPSIGGGFEVNGGGMARISRVDQQQLAGLARTGGGTYTPLTTDQRDLDQLLGEGGGTQRLAEADHQLTGGVERWQEEGIWLLPLVLLLAATGWRKGWLFALVVTLLLAPRPARAFTWSDLWQRPDQQAAQLLEQGEAKEAAARFRDPAWRAAAQYAAGDFTAAAETLSAQPGADYNLGNALARAGKLAEALSAYERAVAQNSSDQDAIFNRDLVRKLLEQQKQQDRDKQQQEQQPGDKQKDQQQGQQNKEQEQQAGSQGSSGAEPEQKPAAQQEPPAQPSQKSNQNTGQNTGQNADQDATPPQAQSATDQKPETSPAAPPNTAPKADPAAAQTPRPSPQQAGEGQPAAREEDKESAQSAAAGEEALSEKEMVLEQWLRQIPDDPSRLLRRKFMLEHQRKQEE